MRKLFAILLLLGTFSAFADAPASGRIVKTLPLLLDLNGHDAVSPSLFDRDAYQFYLRAHTNEISAVRYDVLWEAGVPAQSKLKIRVELHGTTADGKPLQKILENEVKPSVSRHWASLTLGGEDYKQYGSAITAWRVTLWAGDSLLSEQKSFLW